MSSTLHPHGAGKRTSQSRHVQHTTPTRGWKTDVSVTACPAHYTHTGLENGRLCHGMSSTLHPHGAGKRTSQSRHVQHTTPTRGWKTDVSVTACPAHYTHTGLENGRLSHGMSSTLHPHGAGKRTSQSRHVQHTTPTRGWKTDVSVTACPAHYTHTGLENGRLSHGMSSTLHPHGAGKRTSQSRHVQHTTPTRGWKTDISVTACPAHYTHTGLENGRLSHGMSSTLHPHGAGKRTSLSRHVQHTTPTRDWKTDVSVTACPAHYTHTGLENGRLCHVPV